MGRPDDPGGAGDRDGLCGDPSPGYLAQHHRLPLRTHDPGRTGGDPSGVQRHPAAVLAAALICARVMGFLGIFLAAPLVATLELAGRYVLCKLRDEDPWEGIKTVEEPVPLSEFLAGYKLKLAEKYDKIINQIKYLRTRSIGGKGHGSNGN